MGCFKTDLQDHLFQPPHFTCYKKLQPKRTKWFSQGHTIINGIEKMRTQVSWLPAQWFFHYITLQSVTTNYSTQHKENTMFLYTTLHHITPHYSVLYYLSINYTTQHNTTSYQTLLYYSVITILYTVYYTILPWWLRW